MGGPQRCPLHPKRLAHQPYHHLDHRRRVHRRDSHPCLCPSSPRWERRSWTQTQTTVGARLILITIASPRSAQPNEHANRHKKGYPAWSFTATYERRLDCAYGTAGADRVAQSPFAPPSGSSHCAVAFRARRSQTSRRPIPSLWPHRNPPPSPRPRTCTSLTSQSHVAAKHQPTTDALDARDATGGGASTPSPGPADNPTEMQPSIISEPAEPRSLRSSLAAAIASARATTANPSSRIQSWAGQDADPGDSDDDANSFNTRLAVLAQATILPRRFIQSRTRTQGTSKQRGDKMRAREHLTLARDQARECLELGDYAMSDEAQRMSEAHSCR